MFFKKENAVLCALCVFAVPSFIPGAKNERMKTVCGTKEAV